MQLGGLTVHCSNLKHSPRSASPLYHYTEKCCSLHLFWLLFVNLLALLLLWWCPVMGKGQRSHSSRTHTHHNHSVLWLCLCSLCVDTHIYVSVCLCVLSNNVCVYLFHINICCSHSKLYRTQTKTKDHTKWFLVCVWKQFAVIHRVHHSCIGEELREMKNETVAGHQSLPSENISFSFIPSSFSSSFFLLKYFSASGWLPDRYI